MIGTKQFLFTLVILFISGYSFASELTLKKSISNLATEVESLQKCGGWKDNDSTGFYRVILGYNYGRSELYIQWIKSPKDPTRSVKSEVVVTQSIEVFNANHASYELTDIVCKETSFGISVILEADNDNEDNGIYDVIIDAREPGNYKIRMNNKNAMGNNKNNQ